MSGFFNYNKTYTNKTYTLRKYKHLSREEKDIWDEHKDDIIINNWKAIRFEYDMYSTNKKINAVVFRKTLTNNPQGKTYKEKCDLIREFMETLNILAMESLSRSTDKDIYKKCEYKSEIYKGQCVIYRKSNIKTDWPDALKNLSDAYNKYNFEDNAIEVNCT